MIGYVFLLRFVVEVQNFRSLWKNYCVGVCVGKVKKTISEGEFAWQETAIEEDNPSESNQQ